MLTALREVIQEHSSGPFPVDPIRLVMSQRGKSLTFEAAEIEDLLRIEYGDKRTFPLLSLLFPFVDLRNQFHVDHIFPISRFTTARLLNGGFGAAEVEIVARDANQLPNLQLLDGAVNNEKRATLPADWLTTHLPDPTARQHYRTKHDLGEVPADLSGFEKFFAARRERLRIKLIELLGGAAVTQPLNASAPQ